mgnify:CR=1 FL=1
MVRVRFAPSPTGPLHIGGVRTALFNYLFARHHGGTMVLRIEDTDSKRFVPGAEDYIIESLQWLGIEIDEGIGSDNQPYGPYRQSERRDIYREYVQQLIERGAAYYAFDTMEEVSRLLESGEEYVVRFKVDPDREVEVDDLIRGKVVISSAQLDDKVLYKSADDLPTYHLANIVDDHLMQISHVIRGEEWLPSAPLHVLLYEAFGWKDSMPQFAHLSLLLKPQGSGKLSKRDGDKLGFPVFPLEWRNPEDGSISMGYREQGYLPEAVSNFLALLGWNPGTDQELFADPQEPISSELISAFSLDRCSKSGARFDFEKAKWFNHQYIQLIPVERLMAYIRPALSERGLNPSDEQLRDVLLTIRDKAQLLPDLLPEVLYFFVAPTEYDAKGLKKHWKEETPSYLQQIITLLEGLPSEASLDTIEQALYDKINGDELPMGKVMNGIRMALVGAPRGARIHEIIYLLGIPESVRRMQYAIEEIQL